jgi:hypothetical protein
MGIGCDMTGGSSGGGWVTDPSAAGYLNGLNSYKYSNQPNVMYGPYFGDTIKALYEAAASEAPGGPATSGAGNSVPAAENSSASPRPSSVTPRPSCRKVKSQKRGKRRRACKAQRAKGRA